MGFLIFKGIVEKFIDICKTKQGDN